MLCCKAHFSAETGLGGKLELLKKVCRKTGCGAEGRKYGRQMEIPSKGLGVRLSGSKFA
jgi:hypothetical protein